MTFKPLSMTGLLCLSLSLLVPQTSRSQFTGVIVPPTAADNYVASPALPGMAINCDMLQYGLPASANKLLSVIAWEDIVGNSNCNGSKFKVMDHATGQTVTIAVPNGGAPDVVLCSVPGNGSLYKIGLVVSQSCTPNGIWLLVYNVTGVGTPSLTVTLASTSQISNMWGPPHIDLFMDPVNAPLPGWPTLHEFVVVWNQWNPNIVWGVKGDLLTPPTTMPVPTYIGDGAVPDVATVTDGSKKIAHIAYITAPSNSLKLASWNAAGTINTQTLATVATPSGFGQPRIESFGYFPSGVSMTNFQAQVVTGLDYDASLSPRIIDILAYNRTSGTLNTVNCSVSPLNNGLSLWPTVTGGGGQPGMSEYVANIGNQQYTLGWYYEANPSGDYYATYLTGNGTVPVNQSYWKVNSNPTNNLMTNFNGNLHNPYIAMSVSSNTGMGLLTAWWDGNDIQYKLSSSMAFKPSSVGAFGSGSGFKVYPNPATDKLFVESKDVKQYMVTDAVGRTVLAGDVNESIDVSQLQAGAYMLSLINEKGERSSMKFVKE